MVLHRIGVEDATVHEFRAAFSGGIGNEMHFQRKVAKADTAHVVRDRAEQADRRSDTLKSPPSPDGGMGAVFRVARRIQCPLILEAS